MNLDSAKGEEIIGDYGTAGLWTFDGAIWSRMCWDNPEDMAAADLDGEGTNELEGDFGSSGLWWR